MKKKLYRDPVNKQLAGVCSGIAEFFGIDPTIVRLLWVFAVLFVGTGVLAYIICAILIPEKPFDYYNFNETDYNDVQSN